MVAEVSRDPGQVILWEMPLAQGRQYQQLYWVKNGIALVYPTPAGGGELAEILME